MHLHSSELSPVRIFHQFLFLFPHFYFFLTFWWFSLFWFDVKIETFLSIFWFPSGVDVHLPLLPPSFAPPRSPSYRAGLQQSRWGQRRGVRSVLGARGGFLFLALTVNDKSARRSEVTSNTTGFERQLIGLISESSGGAAAVCLRS